MEFFSFFWQNQMNCKDLTNCHPNDNRKGEKSSKISIKLWRVQFNFWLEARNITKLNLNQAWAQFMLNLE